MIVITDLELKERLDKYIDLSAKEDILVKKNGKVVSMLTSNSFSLFSSFCNLSSFLSLSGKYPYVDYQKLLDERDAHR